MTKQITQETKQAFLNHYKEVMPGLTGKTQTQVDTYIRLIANLKLVHNCNPAVLTVLKLGLEDYIQLANPSKVHVKQAQWFKNRILRLLGEKADIYL